MVNKSSTRGSSGPGSCDSESKAKDSRTDGLQPSPNPSSTCKKVVRARSRSSAAPFSDLLAPGACQASILADGLAESLELDQDRPLLDLVALGIVELHDPTVAGRNNGVLHLHRLEHQERRPARHPIAG